MNEIILNENYCDYKEETTNTEKLITYKFCSSLGKIQYQFLKRELPFNLDGQTFYDLTTPFPYGGPIITDIKGIDNWELVDEFRRAFQSYCEQNRIISEFVCFDPVILNAVDFVHCYEVEYIGELSGANLVAYNNSKQKKNLKKYNDQAPSILESKLNRDINRFNQNTTYKLCIGKKIWNNKVYKKACNAVEVGFDRDFFPAYRKTNFAVSDKK